MSAVNDYFQKIFCINLDRRTDKWATCETEFAKHGLSVERVSAVDGTGMKGTLMPGEIGCSLSHAKVMQMIIDQGLKNALVLEDDVEFVDDLQQRFSSSVEHIPQGWVLMYFGGNNINPPVRMNQYIAKITKTYTTSSYGISNSMAWACVEKARAPIKQVDVMYASMQRSNCYIFHPPLAWQRPSISDIQNGATDYTPYMRPKI